MFSYPRYGSQILAPIYKYLPDVTKIRATVANAFKVDPQLEDTRAAMADGERLDLDPQRQRPANPGAEPRRLPRLLRPERLGADHEGRHDRRQRHADRRLQRRGGGPRARRSQFLEDKFDTKVELKNDPTIPVDIVITTTSRTKTLHAAADELAARRVVAHGAEVEARPSTGASGLERP